MKVTVLFNSRGLLTAADYQALTLNLWGQFVKQLEQKDIDELAEGGWVSLELKAGEQEGGSGGE